MEIGVSHYGEFSGYTLGFGLTGLIHMENDMATKLEQAARHLLEVADGIQHGTDWNNGTHAKIYRPKFPAAIAAVLEALDHSGEADEMVQEPQLYPVRRGSRITCIESGEKCVVWATSPTDCWVQFPDGQAGQYTYEQIGKYFSLEENQAADEAYERGLKEGIEAGKKIAEQAEQVAVLDITYGREPECYATPNAEDLPEGTYRLYAAKYEQVEQEPVAWMWACTECGTEAEDGTDCRICSSCGYHKFYKAPKVATCVCAAKTQEKVKQEPVGEVDIHMDFLRINWKDGRHPPKGTKLYTAPVKPVKQEPFMCEPVPPISEDGWTDWVCPKPQGYLMQCCDCGLIHEVDSRVVKYEPMPSEEFEVVENPNMQCQWRVRRRDDLRKSNVKV